MEEERKEPDQIEGEESFADMLEKSLVGSSPLEEGRRIDATILQIGSEWAFLDVGQKGEGVLAAGELQDADGRLTAAAGDKIQVYFLGRREGELRFTTRIGAGSTGTAALEDAWENSIPVEGRLEKEIKGGWEIRLPGGVRAFCPFSQLGLRGGASPGAEAGQSLSFRITKYGERGRSIVVSHRAILEDERRRQREELKKTLREGVRVRGTITNIRDFGAFVDIGGIEGLLPVSEVGWGRVESLSDVLSVGQQVEVVIKSCDWEKDRFSFSLRETLPDPWTKVGSTYGKGSRLAGKVARLVPFGAFVTLEDGVDGLLHISKIGQGRRIAHPREVLAEGENVTVVIDEIDSRRRRISLSLPARGGDEEAVDTSAYVDRPPTSMGTLGDLLKSSREKKKAD